MHSTRRDILQSAAVLSLWAMPAWAATPAALPRRTIPGKNESLPVIGLGSSKAVAQLQTDGTGPLTGVLRALVAHGGSVVDTWPRDAANDAVLGKILETPDLRKPLFVTSKIDQKGKEAGIAQFRQTQKLYGRKQLDLVQIFSLTDLKTHWPTLKQWKAEGDARYIGATVAEYGLYDQMEDFLRHEQPDFIQVNYSVKERKAEDAILPLARDRGVGVIINRPFMNGDFFKRFAEKPLPPWAKEIGCDNWGDFSLKYILPNPSVTCVLTETTNPDHLTENMQGAFGTMPDAATRKRMAAFIDQA